MEEKKERLIDLEVEELESREAPGIWDRANVQRKSKVLMRDTPRFAGATLRVPFTFNSIALSTLFWAMLVAAGLIVPQAAHAEKWNATAGAQSGDRGRQAWAFLPNELWIHPGDSIFWTFASDDTHTVSFLTAGQLRPTIGHDSDVITPDGSSFDGSSYVNSGELTFGKTYTVKFPAAGNFKLSCLAHLYMNGTIHVLKPSDALPYNQAFYDHQAMDQRNHLLSEADHRVDADHRADNEHHDRVIAGTGEILANGGGFQTGALVRFFPETKTVHVGETVEWTNIDPMTTHTITFGLDDSGGQRGLNANLDSDGARHAIVDLPTGNVSSGGLGPLPADRALGNNPGLPPQFKDLMQWPLPIGVQDTNPRFRVTFTHPGTYNYRCVFHDNLGMLGWVIVLP
jgi:plastocyanin